MMDINDVRSAVVLLGLFSFLGLVRWAWGASRRAGFDAAAQLPFEGESREPGHE